MGKELRLVFKSPAKPVPQAGVVQTQKRLVQSSFGTRVLPLMWAKVLQQTGMQTVDLELTNGLKVRNVPVASSRWVKKGTKKDTSAGTGRKDLPQEGTNVLVVFPDGVVDNATVLPISKFDVLQAAHTKTILKPGEQNKIVDVDDYGWTYMFDKDTGKVTFISPDQSSGVKVSITVDVEGKSIQVDQQLSSTSGDKNTVVMDDSGVDIKDKNGNEIKTHSGGVDIDGSSPAAARVGDQTVVDATTDAAFIAWMALIGAFASAFGVVNTPPSSVVGQINSGSSKVSIG